MTRSVEPYKTVNFFDWTGGISDRRKNPLAFPMNALMDGENVELVDGGLSTRAGLSIMSEGSLPRGEVTALKQVRFPTNAVSYLVAQVYEPGDIGIDENLLNIYGHTAVANPDTGKVYVYGGDIESNSMSPGFQEVDPLTGIWTPIEPLDADVAPHHPTGGYYWGVGVWDAANSRLVLHGGKNVGGAQSNEVWAYDPATNKWQALCVPGTGGGSRYRHGHAAFYYDGALWICGGLKSYNDTNGSPIVTFKYSVAVFDRFDLSAKTWSTVTCTLSGSAPTGNTCDLDTLSYHKVIEDSGLVYSYGGWVLNAGNDEYSNCIIISDLSGETATWGDNLINDTGICLHDMALVDGAVVISGGFGPTGETYADTFLTGGLGQTPEPLTITGLTNAATRMSHSMTLAGARLMIVGGRQPSSPGDNPTCLGCDYYSLKTWNWTVDNLHPTFLTGGYKLFVSSDRLPSSTATFTAVASLGGDAGPISVAVLNDRAVITEGIAKPPWVWGGCMAEDASDWMFPKAVLVTPDGTGFYDISSQVCDSDVDNAASIGNIRANGYVAVCCDMPNVDAFYFEMNVPNSVPTPGSGNTSTQAITFSTASDFTRENLKDTIDHWTKDSTNHGHFENVGNSALSLGAGNDCEDVEAGMILDFGTGTYHVTGITDDGSGTGDVTINPDHATGSVSGMYGLTVASSAVGLTTGTSLDADVWSVAPDQTTRYPGFSIRQVIKGSDLSGSGDRVRVTIKVGDPVVTIGEEFAPIKDGYFNSLGLVEHAVWVRHVSIVERDPDTENGIDSPTAITFPGRGSLYVSGPGTQVYEFLSHTAGEEFRSNSIAFPVAPAKDYLVTIDLLALCEVSSVGGPWHRVGDACPLNMSAGAGFYYKAAPSGTYGCETWNQQTVTGFSFVPDYVLGLVKIETDAVNPVPQAMFVGHTTTANRLDLNGVDDFIGITSTESVPGSCTLVHAVSFDNRATFKIWSDDAWYQIVRQNTGTWQYRADATTWTNAPVNTLLSALKAAFALPSDQLTGTQLAAISKSQWQTTGGVTPRITSTIDLAFGMQADTEEAPSLTSYTMTYADAGVTTIQVFSGGDWTAADGWTDNTKVNDVPWAVNGTVEYNGASACEADYHVLDEVPGYWYRFLTNGTNADCSITKVMYKAPCQPLANIGDGQPDTVLGCFFYKASTKGTTEFSVELSDNAIGSLSRALVPMTTGDYLYVGHYFTFNEILLTFDDTTNANASVLSAEYWNGQAWTALTITDGTSTSGKTLSTTGRVSWSIPAAWKMNIPVDTAMRGYWIRLKVSASLSSTAAIAEVRIYPIPPALAKHKLAVTVRDRIALLGRPDAPDQCDVSRALEEYGWVGDDSGSYRVGGMDGIQSAVAGWNGLFVGKSETWHQLVGHDPSTFAFDGVEAARQIPVNSRVIVKAPMGGIDAGTRHGLFFINRFGAFVSTGLHTDAAWNTARGALLSDSVNWWDQRSVPRLCLDGLHRACGEYWPVKNWIVWSVSMVTEPEGSIPSRNNRLIIFDLSLRTWLPPFTISLASLATAYHYNGTAPGRLGEMGLYGGDYEGRIVRLFGPSDTSDFGVPIAAWIETGWLHLGSPDWLKLIRRLQIYGQTSLGKDIAIKIWTDGNTNAAAPDHVMTLSELDCPFGSFFGREEATLNIQGRFFKFRIEFQDVTHIYGMQMGTSFIREWGAV